MQNILKASKNVFYLKYQPQTLAERLEFQKQNRPLIAHLGNEELLDFVRKHLFDRNPYYSQATHIITMDNLSEKQALETILSLISD
ncbi:Shikimate kinase (fragment) [Capnocytophaga canimorsus]|uniref:Shikimate kinase n=2 Tax=Capnocytophaga canimorsus TaxID=28188 RepID=A0A0B7HL10_9FLAO